MTTLAEMRAAIVEISQTLSIRQIAIRSGLNYITLRNIVGGKSQRTTDRVLKQFTKFAEGYKPDPKNTPRRGRKPGSLTAKADTATKTVDKKKAPKAVKAPGKVKAVKSVKRVKIVKPVVKEEINVAPKGLTVPGGTWLKEEIRKTEAKLIYLRTIEKAEKELLVALEKK
jgi:hypothetical protein